MSVLCSCQHYFDLLYIKYNGSLSLLCIRIYFKLSIVIVVYVVLVVISYINLNCIGIGLNILIFMLYIIPFEITAAALSHRLGNTTN